MLTTHQSTERPRVAVIGDVGGHSHRLRRLLEKDLGVRFDLPAHQSPTGHGWWEVAVSWPEGLHVIQVGDLVHRGPDSAGVLQFVDQAMAAGVWTQVVGNHEQLYVGPKSFTWHESLDPDSRALLASWWEAGTLRPAAGVSTASPGPDVVVTHAGVTAGFHSHVLGRPADAGEAVAALNDPALGQVLWTPGLMLGGPARFDAGPVWAEAANEVYASWYCQQPYLAATYAQVHGHTSAFRWSGSTWRLRDPLFTQMRADLRADPGSRHLTATIGGVELVGVDPCHGKSHSRIWKPKVFCDATVF